MSGIRIPGRPHVSISKGLSSHASSELKRLLIPNPLPFFFVAKQAEQEEEDVAYCILRGIASQSQGRRRGLHACERTVRR